MAARARSFNASTRRRIAGTRRWLPAVAAVMALAGSLALLVVQTRVTHPELDETRTCGSALDTIADRSGWQRWWASDLDEPDDSLRESLLRTQRCPPAVNRRIGWAATLGMIGTVLLVIDRRGRQPGWQSADGLGERLHRTGRAASWAGAAVGGLGLAAIGVVVADADATMFLYVDRPIVAMIGLVVLTPAAVLFVVGRALVLLGVRLGSAGEPSDA